MLYCEQIILNYGICGRKTEFFNKCRNGKRPQNSILRIAERILCVV